MPSIFTSSSHVRALRALACVALLASSVPPAVGKPVGRKPAAAAPPASAAPSSPNPAPASASSGPAPAPAPKGLTVVVNDSIMAKSAEFAAVRKYALIVGINRYDNKDQGINALRFAVGDANAIYRSLVDPRRGGFKPEDVTLLTDSTNQKPTNTNIGRALNQLITATHEDDLVLVYFSGHGYEEEGRAYLLPTNADLTALDYSAIERDAFVRQIDKIPAKKVVVVLDACHSGGVNRGGKGVGRDAALSNRYYDSFASSQGRAFIASSSGGELSWEDEDARHGVFTQSLVQALSGAADLQPADGLVTLHEVQQYLEGSVSDWAGRRGKSQHPQVNLESARGDMPLAINQAFLEQQSQELAARHELATRLRDGLSKADGLSLTELSQSLAVADRYGRGDAMNGADSTVFAYAQRLADGGITADEYRTGIARSIRMTTAAQMGLGAHKSSKKKMIIGGIGLAVLGGVAASVGGGGSSGGPATPVVIGDPPPPPAPAPAP